ncbi:MAG: oxidoreductase [Chitinophagales bacterium]|nr:oxidoreductase [Chitinophagales bacterium]
MRCSVLMFILLFLSPSIYGQKYTLRYVDTKTDASFRGLSVAGDNSVWVSGSKGWIGRSIDGGNNWSFQQVPGYEHCDFRTLYAFNANNAVIANAGSPAYILHTADGGTTWQKVYENNDSAAFIDGVDFWDKKHGLIHGDPIGGRMLLLYTNDGGKTWQERKEKQRPVMAEGEASFAASGTVISCFLHGAVVVAVGGKTSRLLFSRNRGRHWRSIPTPMLATSASTGIFSFIHGRSVGHWLIAGGDYRNDTLKKANFFYSLNKGETWHAPVTTTRGYRECLANISDRQKRERPVATFAVGPSGIDISTDDGVNWEPLSDDKGFHVIKPSYNQDKMFLAGANGSLAVMEMN